MKQLGKFFKSIVDIPRMSVGKKQTIETLIKEEALMFAHFLETSQIVTLLH